MAIVEGTLLDDGGAVFNVMNSTFGAVGNGTANDGPALSAAGVAAAGAGGGWVTLPRRHRVDAALTLGTATVGVQLQPGAAVIPASGVTVTVEGPVEARTAWIDRSLGGTVAFGGAWGGVAQLRWWGPAADGTTDDAAVIAAAAQAVADAGGGTLVLAPGTYLVDQDLALPATVAPVFLRGAVVKPGAGRTVTVNGALQAGLWRWIDPSAGGVVRFGASAVERILPQWWGARGDGTGDDAPAIQAALDAVPGGGTVFIPQGTYPVDTMLLLKTDGVSVMGDGPASLLVAGSGMTGETFLLELATEKRTSEVCHLRFRGKGRAAGGPSGVHAAPLTFGMNIHHCYFEDLSSSGAADHSSSVEGMTTNCIFYRCFIGAVSSGTTNTYSLIVADNVFVDCILGVQVQYGYGTVVSNNTFQYTAGYVPLPGDGAIVVLGQYGAVVEGNVIDCRRMNPVYRLSVGIRVGSDIPISPTLTRPERVRVLGNVVTGRVEDGILLKGARDCLVSGNSVAEAVNGINLSFNTDSYLVSTGCTVRDNTVSAVAVGILEGEEEGERNLIESNRITDAALAISLSSVGETVVRWNEGFATEASGEATLPAGATSVAVPSALALDPGPGRVQVTPAGSLGTAARFWVTGVSASGFEIRVNAAPGVAVPFSWAVLPRLS